MPEAQVLAALDKKIEQLNKLRTKRASATERWQHFKNIKETIARNPRLIAEHAAAYAELARRQREEAVERLRQNAGIYVVYGEIEEAQLKRLAKENPGMTEQEILKLLGATVKGKSTTNFKEDNSVRETDPSVMKTIAGYLEKAGKRDLYDFLGVSQSEKPERIKAVCDRLYASAQSSGSLDERTLINQLVGQARTQLLTPANRASYDKALANSVFGPIRELIKNIAAAATVIAPTQYEALLEACTRKGISIERAESFIMTEAAANKLNVLKGNTNTRVCRFCGAVNPAGNKLCTSCGMPFAVECPGCGRISDNDKELRCEKCGFPIGEMPEAMKNVENAERSLSFGNISEAERYISLASRQWRGYKPIAQVEKRIADARRTASSAIQELKTLVEQRKYFAALAKSKSIPLTPECQPLVSRAESAVAKARQLLGEAASASDPNMRVDAYAKVLAEAADCPEALDGIRKTPLAPPVSVTASVRGRSATISWPARSYTYIKYKVVRKEGSRPSSVSDGTAVGETAGNSIDDSRLPAGASCFYGVFAVYDSAASPKGAVTSQPVMVADDISLSDVTAAVEQNQIKFSFSLPKNAVGVNLYRDGSLVKTVSGSVYIDTGLTPDRPYRYKFVTLYRDISGKTVESQGVETTLSPTAPPRPVKLDIADLGDRVRLSWNPPAKGAFAIYVADSPFRETLGETFAVDRLRARTVSFSGNMVELRKDFCGVRFYLPVTVVGSMGVAGQQVKAVSVREPEGVAIDKNDNFVNVSWKWGTTPAVRVEWQIGAGRTVSRDIPSSSPSRLRIDFPAGTPSVSVAVRSIVESPEGPLLSSPVEKTLSLTATKVHFEDVKSKAKFFGLVGGSDFSLTLRADSALPCALALLVREGSVPVDLVNTRPVLTISPSDLRPGSDTDFDFSYSRRDKSTPVYFRLIAADRSCAPLLSITPESHKIK